MSIQLKKLAPLSCILLPLCNTQAWAEEERPFANSIRFELGAGVETTPSYEGASSYRVGPAIIARVTALHWGPINFGDGPSTGFSIGPSFRYLDERKASDDASLAGTKDIDASLELGLSLSYEWEAARLFAQARYGVTGHNGIVGEAGADAILRPTEETKILIGPRISFANDKYFDTYFSVPDTATELASYEASGGVKSVGVAASVRHDFSDTWAIEASAQWDRLVGDAADSPIVQAGSENQFTAKIGIIRKFSFDF